MLNRQLASVLLALCLASCGAAPSNLPQPIANFQPTAPVGASLNPADTVPATGDDTATEEEPSADDEPDAEASDAEADPTDPGTDETADAPGSDDTADADLPSLLDLPSDSSGGDEVIPLKNSLFSDWQATGIAVSNGQIFITASDRTGFSKRGTILTLDAKGKWQDIAATRLSVPLLNKIKFGHKLNNTLRGIATDSFGNIAAVEAAGHLGHLTSAGAKLKLITGGPSGLLDVVAANNAFYLSMGNQIRKLSPDLASSEAIASNLMLTGGMGSDKTGNFFAVSQGNIVKVTPTGTVSTVIGNVTNPVDVAVNAKGHLFVLTTNVVLEFDDKGQSVQNYGAGQIKNGAAITIDDGGRLYVADTGKNKKDSQILAFAAK